MVQLGGFGSSLLSDSIMNLRKIAIIAAGVLTDDRKLYQEVRFFLNCMDTVESCNECELKLGKVHSNCMEKMPALAVM